MKCRCCHEKPDFSGLAQLCPGLRNQWPHLVDNRHAPNGDPCACGRAASAHRVFHKPMGDPCQRAGCSLPSASHVTRKSGHSPLTITRLRVRDGWICQLCGRPFPDPPFKWPHAHSVTVDHVVNVREGGGDALANLRLAHAICNVERSNRERDA